MTQKITLEQAKYYWDFLKVIDSDNRKNLDDWKKTASIPFVFETVGVDEVGIFFTEDEIVVAIDGSDKDKAEWKGNFKPYGGLKNFFSNIGKSAPKNSYTGFHQDYIFAANMIIEWMSRHIHPRDSRPIRFIGHSRGAAIATDTYLIYNKYDSTSCTPFAPPRSLLRWKVDYYKAHKKDKLNIHAFFIKGDIVDNVPFAFLGWRHIFTEKTMLPRVRGFNHIRIGRGIDKAIRKRNGKR